MLTGTTRQRVTRSRSQATTGLAKPLRRALVAVMKGLGHVISVWPYEQPIAVALELPSRPDSIFPRSVFQGNLSSHVGCFDHGVGDHSRHQLQIVGRLPSNECHETEGT